MTRNLIILIFLISGMAGLTYEVVWVRMLTLIFGTTTYAVSTVLFSFMSGLALGSYLFGKYVDSVRSPLLLYAFLELGIGITALMVPHAIETLNTAYVSMFDASLPNPLLYSLYRFLFSLLVLIVPTTLMGATLPVLSRFFVRKLETVGWDVGILYTINTLGAVIGAFIAGYYLEATFGVNTTINIAASANILAGILAGFIFWTTHPQTQDWQKISEPPITELKDRLTEAQYTYPHMSVIFWVFAVSGFCAIGFEVIWFRTLLLALFNTTYAFTTMLVAFLAGLAIGSYLISNVLDMKRNWPVILGTTLISIGVIAALTVPLFILYHNTSFMGMRHVFSGSIKHVTAAGFYLSGFLMLIPTVAMGLTLPLANKIYIDNIKRVGQRIGRLYAINTIGGVIGSLVTGFMLIPSIGIVRAGLVLASLYIAAGAVVLYFSKLLIPVRNLFLLTSTILIIFSVATIFTAEWPSRLQVTLAEGLTVISYTEGASSTVTVVETSNGTRAAFVNGNIVVGATPGAKQTVRLLAHLPILLQQNADSAVIIGFGMGITTYSVSLHDLDTTDVVEIAPEILKNANLFYANNHNVINNEKLNVIVEDGRNYLLRTRKQYSVITADPTHPILGSGNLYTKEYYEQAYKKLNDDGIIVQYVPLHLLKNSEFRTLIRTFVSVFKHSSLWYSTTDLVIMGTKSPQSFDYTALEQAISRPAIKQDLELSNIGTATLLLGHLLMGEKELKKYSSNAEINTDDHPVIEFKGPTSVGQNTRSTNLESILPYLAETTNYVDLTGLQDDERDTVVRAINTNDSIRYHILRGLRYDSMNAHRDAVKEYRMALRLNPGDADVRRLIRDAKIRLKQAN